MQYQKTEQDKIDDLEKESQYQRDLLKEARQEIKDLKTFERKYVEVFNDNTRIIKSMKDNLDKDTFEKICDECDNDISIDVDLEND